MSTMDIVEFLLARYDEREQVARAAYDEAGDYRVVGSELAEAHFAYWKPAEVLADIAVKKKIVAHYLRGDGGDAFPSDEEVLAEPRRKPFWWEPESEQWATRAIRLLALPFADHPDYQESWRP